MSKVFNLGTVLTITSGIVLCPVDEIYEILNYMTGDNLMTHSLPRAMDICQEPLLEQFSELRGIKVPEMTGQEECSKWLDSISDKYGRVFVVSPLKEGVYKYVDPIEELVDMAGADKMIIVET